MLLIYTDHITPRLKYIFKFVLSELLGLNYELTNSSEYYQNATQAKLTYAQKPFNKEAFIKAQSLLFEDEIIDYNITVSKENNIPIFFKNSKNNLLPFDIFAASFYLISRYEEYTKQNRDLHDRFDAKQSIAFQNNFLDQPIIDQWAYWLKDTLQTLYPSSLKFNERKFNFLPTFDIDQAFAISNKGFTRTTAGLLKSLVKVDLKDFLFRIRVLRKKEIDPFNTFSTIKQLHLLKKTKPYFFFLVAKYSKYDKNISPSNIKFKGIINYISKNYTTGIHPSYTSHKNINVLQSEIATLESITQQKTICSRQHFLRISFPETYQNLLKTGIEKDFSLGYATHTGFRAGTCTPFLFYDLTQNKETKLQLFPFCVMDVTLKNYLLLTPKQSTEKITELITSVKKINGTFISIWHNESLSNHGEWKNWQEVYERMLEIAG